MKTTTILSTLLTVAISANALTIPSNDISKRDEFSALAERDDVSRRDINDFTYLEKRRGGGGGGGRGGSSSSGGSSSGSSSSSGGRSGSSSSSGGTTSSGGSTSSSGGRTGSSSSSSGGRYVGGSGSYRGYGGGSSYAGGATSPYSAGRRSPRGILPILLPLAAVSTIFTGLWLYSVYSYSFNNPYNWRNVTSGRNQSLPVQCLCEQYNPCGCDENSNSSYIDSLLATNLNNVTRIVNNTLYINGTLENGTTAPNLASGAATMTAMDNMGFVWMAGVVMYIAFGL